jgi:hypothetical protein
MRSGFLIFRDRSSLLHSLLNLSNYFLCACVQSFQVVEELTDIQLALSRFNLGNERLWAIKLCGKFRLSQPLFKAKAFQNLEQLLPAVCVDGFREPLFQGLELTQKQDYPIFWIFLLAWLLPCITIAWSRN